MDQRLFESLDWRNIGPHRAGRVVCAAGDPYDRAVFYFGSCGGGVWKTDDAGSHWFNVTDGYLNTAAIGAIAVSEADPNVIWVGTGETSIRSNVTHGDGVYRSVDGGKTWQHLGLEDTRHIGAIAVDPHDPDVALVAALGHAWGRNSERGVYKTTDGGETWRKVLYKSDKAGAVDLSMDPNNPRFVYATIWEAQRFPWAASSGGEDCGLWRSSDGGETWEDITDRLGFEGVIGKIGVAVSPANGDRVWALVEAEDGAMLRSDDGGETWNRVSEDPELRRRAWYYMHVFADPSDADTVWVLNLQCWKSTDGGKTYENIPTPHGDNHALWIDPVDSDRIIEGNDGGACVSFNG
ncbi:MAG: WD40/YVTN/BNR-like repeat-containing protein, partial [Chloroflexota bacterium]